MRVRLSTKFSGIIRGVGEAKLAVPQHMLITCVPWQSFEKIVDALSEHHLRITYDRGALELLSPRGDDIPDPIGSPAEVYRECARVIVQNLEPLLPQLEAS